MAEDGGVWASTEAGPSQVDSELPSVIDILVETFEDCRDHFGGYLLAGLGMFLIQNLILMGSLVVMVAVIALAIAPGVLMNDEVVQTMGLFGGFFGGLLVILVGTAIFIPPLQASVGRAVQERVVSQSDLTFTAVLSTWQTDLWKVIGTHMLQMAIVFTGMLFCYIPGLIAIFFLGFAMPSVIVHSLRPTQAIRLSFTHAMAHPTWHLGYFAVIFGIGMALAYIPFLGSMLLVTFLPSFQLRCYTAIFGVGPRPEGFDFGPEF